MTLSTSVDERPDKDYVFKTVPVRVPRGGAFVELNNDNPERIWRADFIVDEQTGMDRTQLLDLLVDVAAAVRELDRCNASVVTSQ